MITRDFKMTRIVGGFHDRCLAWIILRCCSTIEVLITKFYSLQFKFSADFILQLDIRSHFCSFRSGNEVGGNTRVFIRNPAI